MYIYVYVFLHITSNRTEARVMKTLRDAGPSMADSGSKVDDDQLQLRVSIWYLLVGPQYAASRARKQLGMGLQFWISSSLAKNVKC